MKKFKTLNLNKIIMKGNEACKINLTLDENYVLTVSLINGNNEVIDSKQVDFPVESMVVDAEQQGENLILTLQNGNTVTVSLADLFGKIKDNLESMSETVDGLKKRLVYGNPNEPVQASTGQTVNGNKQHIHSFNYDWFETDPDYFVVTNTSKDLFVKICSTDGSGNITETVKEEKVELFKQYDFGGCGDYGVAEFYADLSDAESAESMKTVNFEYFRFKESAQTIDKKLKILKETMENNKTAFDNFKGLARPYVVNHRDNGIDDSACSISNGINTNRTFNNLVTYITNQVDDQTFFPPVYRYEGTGELEGRVYYLPFLKYDSTENVIYFGGIEALDPAHPNLEIVKLKSNKKVESVVSKAL